MGLWGCCWLTHRENAFSPDDLAFLTQIARQVAIAVENALAFGEVSELKNKLTLEKLYLEDDGRQRAAVRRNHRQE